ncbi:hypothetical protein [Streptomyces cyaneofuscatus]|nr:hypothetical protein [Streptomyces sp. MT29]
MITAEGTFSEPVSIFLLMLHPALKLPAIHILAIRAAHNLREMRPESG